MPTADYQEAVHMLIEFFGGQWQGLEVDGRHEMERLLRDKLGYDRRRARETIDTMVQIGTLRYHPHIETAHMGEAPTVPIVPVGTAGTTTTGSEFGGAIPVAGDVSGYWQIGHDLDDTPRRAGQVQPS